MPKDWTSKEDEYIIADYLQMLLSELQGHSINKTEHREQLSPRLDDRSKGSIEFKHQNISAVMIDLGLPYISGYKPRGNYQQMLRKITENLLESFPELIETVKVDVEREAESYEIKDILKLLVPPPDLKRDSIYSRGSETIAKNIQKINYLEREAANSSLGAAGERFVLDFERVRLEAIEKPNLADRIEQISETRGDWAGYDIRSFNENGSDRFIEVKTTRYGIETPFFVSKNELGFSTENSVEYNLYRVFSFRKDPKLFMLPGRLDKTCILDPIQYRARVS